MTDIPPTISKQEIIPPSMPVFLHWPLVVNSATRADRPYSESSLTALDRFLDDGNDDEEVPIQRILFPGRPTDSHQDKTNFFNLFPVSPTSIDTYELVLMSHPTTTSVVSRLVLIFQCPSHLDPKDMRRLEDEENRVPVYSNASIPLTASASTSLTKSRESRASLILPWKVHHILHDPQDSSLESVLFLVVLIKVDLVESRDSSSNSSDKTRICPRNTPFLIPTSSSELWKMTTSFLSSPSSAATFNTSIDQFSPPVSLPSTSLPSGCLSLSSTASPSKTSDSHSQQAARCDHIFYIFSQLSGTLSCLVLLKRGIKSAALSPSGSPTQHRNYHLSSLTLPFAITSIKWIPDMPFHLYLFSDLGRRFVYRIDNIPTVFSHVDLTPGNQDSGTSFSGQLLASDYLSNPVRMGFMVPSLFTYPLSPGSFASSELYHLALSCLPPSLPLYNPVSMVHIQTGQILDIVLEFSLPIPTLPSGNLPNMPSPFQWSLTPSSKSTTTPSAYNSSAARGISIKAHWYLGSMIVVQFSTEFCVFCLDTLSGVLPKEPTLLDITSTIKYQPNQMDISSNGQERMIFAVRLDTCHVLFATTCAIWIHSYSSPPSHLSQSDPTLSTHILFTGHVVQAFCRNTDFIIYVSRQPDGEDLFMLHVARICISRTDQDSEESDDGRHDFPFSGFDSSSIFLPSSPGIHHSNFPHRFAHDSTDNMRASCVSRYTIPLKHEAAFLYIIPLDLEAWWLSRSENNLTAINERDWWKHGHRYCLIGTYLPNIIVLDMDECRIEQRFTLPAVPTSCVIVPNDGTSSLTWLHVGLIDGSLMSFPLISDHSAKESSLATIPSPLRHQIVRHHECTVFHSYTPTHCFVTGSSLSFMVGPWLNFCVPETNHQPFPSFNRIVISDPLHESPPGDGISCISKVTNSSLLQEPQDDRGDQNFYEDSLYVVSTLSHRLMLARIGPYAPLQKISFQLPPLKTADTINDLAHTAAWIEGHFFVFWFQRRVVIVRGESGEVVSEVVLVPPPTRHSTTSGRRKNEETSSGAAFPDNPNETSSRITAGCMWTPTVGKPLVVVSLYDAKARNSDIRIYKFIRPSSCVASGNLRRVELVIEKHGSTASIDGKITFMSALLHSRRLVAISAITTLSPANYAYCFKIDGNSRCLLVESRVTLYGSPCCIHIPLDPLVDDDVAEPWMGQDDSSKLRRAEGELGNILAIGTDRGLMLYSLVGATGSTAHSKKLCFLNGSAQASSICSVSSMRDGLGELLFLAVDENAMLCGYKLNLGIEKYLKPLFRCPLPGGSLALSIQPGTLVSTPMLVPAQKNSIHPMSSKMAHHAPITSFYVSDCFGSVDAFISIDSLLSLPVFSGAGFGSKASDQKLLLASVSKCLILLQQAVCFSGGSARAVLDGAALSQFIQTVKHLLYGELANTSLTTFDPGYNRIVVKSSWNSFMKQWIQYSKDEDSCIHPIFPAFLNDVDEDVDMQEKCQSHESLKAYQIKERTLMDAIEFIVCSLQRMVF